jgi:hypothetical protein
MVHYFQVIRLELVDRKLQPWIAKKCGLSQLDLIYFEGSCLLLPLMMDDNSNFFQCPNTYEALGTNNMGIS